MGTRGSTQRTAEPDEAKPNNKDYYFKKTWNSKTKLFEGRSQLALLVNNVLISSQDFFRYLLWATKGVYIRPFETTTVAL